MRLFISREEHLRRLEAARREFDRRGLVGLVLFSPMQVFYLTGFSFIATERPAALVVTDNRTTLFVPRLEEEHATAHAVVDQVVSYPEYPGDVHPMRRLASLLTDLGVGRGPLGADGEGYPGVMGYLGPRMREVLPDVSEADVLRELMRANGLSQLKLAKAVGISQSTISAVLTGARSLTKDQVVVLGRFFHVHRPLSWRCRPTGCCRG